jgi:hypothetical protein
MDVDEVFVEVDSISCVSDGGGECKHEVRDCSCSGSKIPSPPALRLSCAMRRV